MEQTTILDRIAAVRVFVLDVDGVLTNGQLLVTEEGHLLRAMNIKDGYALQLAVKQGYLVWVISGGKSRGAGMRLERLGVQEAHFGVEDKLQTLHRLLEQYGITDPSRVLYMGDDMPDLAPMQYCGVKCAPRDACMEVIEAADYISPYNGGMGCVRDVVEKVLKVNNHWK
ncbi:MAG: hypothetical protein BGO09_12335 [Bacteroidetes bacterium 47-18]|nr:MAG: hypothetical protein BGO09_12335 [Bacteroidetes bacterium 47-18]